MGSPWKLGVIGMGQLKMLEGPMHTIYARTIGDTMNVDWSLSEMQRVWSATDECNSEVEWKWRSSARSMVGDCARTAALGS